MSEPIATPLSQSIELRVTDQPDVKNKHGIGYIKPTDVHLRYAQDGIHAQVYGLWRRTDTLSREGELTDKRTDQGYDAPAGDMADWPDWLADLAHEHGPAAAQPSAAELAKHVTRAIFAMKSPPPSGSEHYRSGWDDGLEAAIDAARDEVLRRLADEPQQAAR